MSPTNLTNAEAIAINEPIGSGDASVFPGDIIVGDADYVIVNSAHMADDVADEAVEMTAYEDFVAPIRPRQIPQRGIHPLALKHPPREGAGGGLQGVSRSDQSSGLPVAKPPSTSRQMPVM